VGMWGSSHLCEISKHLWKWICDFHRCFISVAASVLVSHHLLGSRVTGCWTLAHRTIVVPAASCAVVLEIDRGSVTIGDVKSPRSGASASDSFSPSW
jgi:hypothetical protein